MGFGDTGYAIILTAFLLLFPFGFGFFDFFFLVPLLELTVSFIALAIVVTPLAVGPAFKGFGELGNFIAILVQPFQSRRDPVRSYPLQRLFGSIRVLVILVVEGRGRPIFLLFHHCILWRVSF